MGTQDRPIDEYHQVKMKRWYQALLISGLVVIFSGNAWIIVR